MLRQTEMSSLATRYGMDPAEFEARLTEARLERARAFAQAGRTIAGWVKGLFAGWVEAYRRRAAYDELNSLDDRMLRDLGLSRGELWSAVEGQARVAAGAGAGNDNERAVAANDDAPRAKPSFKLGA